VFVPFVVTVDVVFCVIELSSTAITGNTKTIQKQATMPNAIVLLIFLFILNIIYV